MQEEKKNNQIYIAWILIYVFVLFIGLHFVEASAAEPGKDLFSSLLAALQDATAHPFALGHAFKQPVSILKMVGIVTAAIAGCYLYSSTDAQSKKHIDSKIAKGSSKFMYDKDTTKFNKKFAAPGTEKSEEAKSRNLILANNLYYDLEPGRNSNVIIMGSAGSGKSFRVIKPNLLQMNSSFVVTDPSGELFRAEAKMLLEHGYEVKVFSTSNMLHSNCYNPFDYVYDEDGQIDETRVSSMINMFLSNAADMQNSKGDKFWDQASKALLNACAMLLLEFYPDEKHNMYEMLRLVQKGKVSEKDADNKTELDMIFDKARKKNPDAHCFSSYDTFKLAPARTANSILISAAVDLNLFNQTKVRNMTTTSYMVHSRNLDGQIRRFALGPDGKPIRTDDNIDIRTVGDKKTCIFINIPQADGTYNFLVSMMYSQLFESLYGRAEKICPRKYLVLDKDKEPILTMIDSKEDAAIFIKLYREAKVEQRVISGKSNYFIVNHAAPARFSLPGYPEGVLRKVYSQEVGEKFLQRFQNCTVKKGAGRLPFHVQCLLDEFSNIGSIPEFPQKLATMRKYEISCMIVLQSLAQLKNRYDKLYADILSNCDNTIFLGSSDPETCKYIAERLGKTTTVVQNKSKSKSAKGSNSSTSINLDSRDLMLQDEVSRLDPVKAIVMTSGQYPFNVTKYSATDHPRWKLTGDYDSDNRIEVADYIYCSEKALSAQGEARQIAENMVKTAGNQNADGKPIVSSGDQVKSPMDLAEEMKVKGKTVNAAANNMKIVPTPNIEEVDADDYPGMPEDFLDKQKKYSRPYKKNY